LAAVAFEITPLANEDGRDIELLGDDAEVRTEGEPDLLGRRHRLVDPVERRVEGGCTVARDVPQQVGLRVDVRVERALLDAHRLGQIADRRPVVALLGEEPGRLASELVSTRGSRREQRLYLGWHLM